MQFFYAIKIITKLRYCTEFCVRDGNDSRFSNQAEDGQMRSTVSSCVTFTNYQAV